MKDSTKTALRYLVMKGGDIGILAKAILEMDGQKNTNG